MPRPGAISNSDQAREMQAKSAEARRRRRDEAEKEAQQAWRDSLTTALNRHIQLLEAEHEPTSLSAVKELYERLLGRVPAQHELTGADGGPVTIELRSSFSDDGPDAA